MVESGDPKADFDLKNPPKEILKAMDAMFDMADLDKGQVLSQDEFRQYVEWWETDKSGWDLGSGNYDWNAIFGNLDYNSNGLMSTNEQYNAMMREGYDDETMMRIFTAQMKFGDKEGNLNQEQYIAMVDHMTKQMEMEKEGHDDGNRGGPRMEITMEKLPDGTERMRMVMEGAQKLAFSAAAVAAASFFTL
jgi:hypothetical protein